MTNMSVLSIVSMLGWLVLALSAYRSHQIGAKQTIVMALTWMAIFAFGFLIFSIWTPAS